MKKELRMTDCGGWITVELLKNVSITSTGDDQVEGLILVQQ
jgi:hypothetical protein